MSYRTAESCRLCRSMHTWLWCALCVALLGVGCTKPPKDEPPEEPPGKDEEQVELGTASAEPNETSGAPYPAAEPHDFIPNMEDEDRWEPVPDGPVVGEMQPANPAVEVKEAEIDKDKKDEPQRP